MIEEGLDNLMEVCLEGKHYMLMAKLLKEVEYSYSKFEDYRQKLKKALIKDDYK